ncbi:MAG: helix-turn-helix domain-containing protein [Yokenella regensburgei]|uniref:Transcriptional regulator n=2 Tax=Yokenella regensburgei TaxID=158877 RepID=A0ABX9RUP3_9ENTR|nr:helix-turn-helix domain-containing protein [Yokenella regensburgei]KAF1369646.1 DNA-binding response OmpR family regulator [Yokenella regensburgei]MDQ4429925.1 helix-turn-helix domain-containing protein [Yokenella regensburgei]MDR2217117.1 helix-turn-helix domain-containing protein [Yokenella regensburgei]MDR3105959.1 helix-turn-helix domain-containing protein [Yokenella regensburgei]QIU90926.1 helix-turn-helix domain-containing protein [Yokenella regensburgei]
MEYYLHGFMIGKEVHVDIANKRAYRIPVSNSDKTVMFAAVFFNKTMLRLFLYMLMHADERHVSRDELFSHVWEEHNLSPSTQRLWQVVSNLNKKLSVLGLPADFILSTKGCGYFVNHQGVIPLYYQATEPPLSIAMS